MATDNCGVTQITNNATSGLPIGTTAVMWYAFDAAGNVDSCAQSITIIDVESPVINCDSNTVVPTNPIECISIYEAPLPPAFDNHGLVSLTNNFAGQYPLGNSTLIWTAVDSSGNTATCVQGITVLDQESPNLVCPDSIVIPTNAGQSTSTASLGPVSAFDNCIAVSIFNNAPNAVPLGETLVTWFAVDQAGNIDSCVQHVTVVDLESPVITCDSVVVFAVDNGCFYSGGFPLPMATDNSGAVTLTHDAPDSIPVGNTLVTWTATDSAGNQASCVQIVLVEDQTPPTITCAMDLTASTDPGLSTFSGTLALAYNYR